ncbi:hypothetical protein [Neorhizobium alkalisoli]|uniref:hypothetical protein n=1 Tax=Neorhizobium alkalisoli TaxID=528178 RepID=UPI00131A34FE|nr:hypothetical protein [Neorhizobium alkalisoli]
MSVLLVIIFFLLLRRTIPKLYLGGILLKSARRRFNPATDGADMASQSSKGMNAADNHSTAPAFFSSKHKTVYTRCHNLRPLENAPQFHYASLSLPEPVTKNHLSKNDSIARGDYK